MNEPFRPSIIISHSPEDRFAAEILAQRLRERGFRPRIDGNDGSGEDARRQWLDDVLPQAKACLVLLSPDGLAWDAVHQTIALARVTGHPTVPLLIRTCTLPSDLAGLSIIDFRRDVELGFEQLDDWLLALGIDSIESTDAAPSTGSTLTDTRRGLLAMLDTRRAEQGRVAGTPIRFAPIMERVVLTHSSVNLALAGAREYLEKAGFRPDVAEGEKKKKKHDAHDLAYTRGSDSRLRLLLIPSPKSIKTDVTVTVEQPRDRQHTEALINYQVHVPEHTTIIQPSHDFWTTEVREIAEAIIAGQAGRSRTRQLAAAATLLCVGSNTLGCAFFLTFPVGLVAVGIHVAGGSTGMIVTMVGIVAAALAVVGLLNAIIAVPLGR